MREVTKSMKMGVNRFFMGTMLALMAVGGVAFCKSSQADEVTVETTPCGVVEGRGVCSLPLDLR